MAQANRSPTRHLTVGAAFCVLAAALFGCDDDPALGNDGGLDAGAFGPGDVEVVTDERDAIDLDPDLDGAFSSDGADLGMDAGPQPNDASSVSDAEILHDLTELTVEGTVTVNGVGPAVRVRVVAHCGGATVETETDDNGAYQVSSNVETCNQLVVEFAKDTFLPTFRVVHLPPPTSPVTMDVNVTELAELQCGNDFCVVEGTSVSRFPAGPMARGWVSVHGGTRAVDFFGGEFRTTDASLLWVTGFGYFDLLDINGARIETLRQPFPECFAVDSDALDQIIDADPSTEVLEMNLYTLDPTNGRWSPRGQGLVSLTDGADEEGEPVIRPATRDDKDDIRSNQLFTQIWVCAEMQGSGWLAWGRAIPQQTCVTARAYDQCGKPVPNVVFSIVGNGYGYKAESWTDRSGRTCLPAVRSEALGDDYDGNEVRGEVFKLDALLKHTFDSQNIPALQMPIEPGTCDEPETCVPLEFEFTDFEVQECD